MIIGSIIGGIIIITLGIFFIIRKLKKKKNNNNNENQEIPVYQEISSPKNFYSNYGIFNKQNENKNFKLNDYSFELSWEIPYSEIRIENELGRGA